jgi:hypothetical protein
MTDVNLTKCLVAKEHLGYTTYINICNDAEKIIPWTTGDWVGFTVAITMIVLLILLVVGCGYIVRDMWR